MTKMTKKLHNLIKKRDRLLKKIHDQPYNKKLEQKYKKHRNLAAGSIKIATRDFYQQKLETTILILTKSGNLSTQF